MRPDQRPKTHTLKDGTVLKIEFRDRPKRKRTRTLDPKYDELRTAVDSGKPFSVDCESAAEAHRIRIIAYKYAKRQGLAIEILRIPEGEQVKLYIRRKAS